MNKFKSAVFSAAKMLWKTIPIILGTTLLVSFLVTLIPQSFYLKIFTGNIFFDSFTGSLIGSLSAGNSLTSYILGGELLKKGVSLIAITAFLITWVTVGIVQLPAESIILGKRFAFLRNILAFISAIVIAILTFLILGGKL
jgi:uncharacterized membrane protein YraQ (UPF0718 family)